MEHFRITVAGNTYDVVVEKTDNDPSERHSAPPPVIRSSAPTPLPTPAIVTSAAKKPVAAEGDVTSPLAGIVQAVAKSIGDPVAEGDLIITLEAMKMYTSITATAAGTIQAIHVKVGDAVDEGQALYSLN
jgi:glutaconyl-CoA/methylmalonyl-CoA decarboxylase subunit gamma